MVVILYCGKSLLVCWWVLTASVVVLEEATRELCKYGRFGGGQRIKQGFPSSAFLVFSQTSHISASGSQQCNGRSAVSSSAMAPWWASLAIFVLWGHTERFLCTFRLSPGVKPVNHDYLNNNGSLLENKIASGKIKANIFSIIRSKIDTVFLSCYRSWPGL